jgi:hypothetical protein
LLCVISQAERTAAAEPSASARMTTGSRRSADRTSAGQSPTRNIAAAAFGYVIGHASLPSPTKYVPRSEPNRAASAVATASAPVPAATALVTITPSSRLRTVKRAIAAATT